MVTKNKVAQMDRIRGTQAVGRDNFESAGVNAHNEEDPYGAVIQQNSNIDLN